MEGGFEVSQYVERECLSCEKGRVHVGTIHEVKTGDCPDCEGSGKVLSYLYPKPKGRRGPWPPEEVAAEEQHTGGGR